MLSFCDCSVVPSTLARPGAYNYIIYTHQLHNLHDAMQGDAGGGRAEALARGCASVATGAGGSRVTEGRPWAEGAESPRGGRCKVTVNTPGH